MTINKTLCIEDRRRPTVSASTVRCVMCRASVSIVSGGHSPTTDRKNSCFSRSFRSSRSCHHTGKERESSTYICT